MTKPTIHGPDEWDPDVCDDSFVPETASDGRDYHVAAWDGGMADLALAVEGISFDTDVGEPAVVVYRSVTTDTPVAFEGTIERINAAGRSATMTVRGDGGDVRKVNAFGDVTNGDRKLGEVLDIRLCRAENEHTADRWCTSCREPLEDPGRDVCEACDAINHP